MKLRCVECGTTVPAKAQYSCGACHGILELIEPAGTSIGDDRYLARTMWRYSESLAVSDRNAIVSLGEGNTPLHRAQRLEETLPGFKGQIWLKDETVNPSGSFKDRLVSAAISWAKQNGYSGVVCASSGNAGAATSAYAARAGMKAIIVVPTHTPEEKLTQIAAYGALLVKVDGHYSYSYDVAAQLARDHGLINATTTFLNPYGVDALKLVGKELAEQFGGGVPDYVVVPTGSGPLIKGVVQGFREHGAGKTPQLIAVQAKGCAPIVRAFEAGDSEVVAWDAPDTIASGISDPLIGYERDGTYSLRLVRETGGIAIAVSDDELRRAMSVLAHRMGVLAEPTGASSFAAVCALVAAQRIPRDAVIVCMVTGHGYKDLKVYRGMPNRIRQLSKTPSRADLAALLVE